LFFKYENRKEFHARQDLSPLEDSHVERLEREIKGMLKKRKSESGIDPDLLAGMKARSIGPAAMSGRIAAIDVVESNPDIIYIGAATGGVWKKTKNCRSMEKLLPICCSPMRISTTQAAYPC